VSLTLRGQTQIKSGSPPRFPDALPSPESVAALRAHPKFVDAARMMMRDVISIYDGNRILNQVMNDRGRVVFGALAFYLHFSRDPGDPAGGLTAARMKALCAETGLCSTGRAAAMLLLMRYAGYLAAVPDDNGGRTQRLMPTDRMFESQRQRLSGHLRAMSLLLPEGTEGLANLHRLDFIASMACQFGESFRAGFRILDTSPALYPLVERNAGLMILFSLFLASDAHADMTSERPAAISIAALARRFGVSRPHVLKLLRDAQALGFVRRGGGNGEQILVQPALGAAVQDFVATVFLFLGQCIGNALNERR
jgi:hypothetical protein